MEVIILLVITQVEYGAQVQGSVNTKTDLLGKGTEIVRKKSL